MGECAWIICKYYATLQKGLEHPQILVSVGVPEAPSPVPGILRDNDSGKQITALLREGNQAVRSYWHHLVVSLRKCLAKPPPLLYSIHAPYRILPKLALSSSFQQSLISFRQNLHQIPHNLFRHPEMRTRQTSDASISLCQWADFQKRRHPLLEAMSPYGPKPYSRPLFQQHTLLDLEPHLLPHAPGNAPRL